MRSIRIALVASAVTASLSVTALASARASTTPARIHAGAASHSTLTADVAAARLAVSVATGYRIVGRGLGSALTGQATDPGSGPVMIIIASLLLAQERHRERSAPERFVPRRVPETTASATPMW